jgi:hypothetical protein
MNSSIYMKGAFNYKALKKALLLFCFAPFVCLTISCKQCNQCNQVKPGNITENLNWLYLNNKDSAPELKTLLDAAKKNQRVIFQLFHDECGILDLNSWPMKNADGQCSKGDAITLHETSVFAASLTGLKVHLGNLHIGKDEYKSLSDHINEKGYDYIIFIPHVEQDPSKGINYIVYDIWGSPTIQGDPNNGGLNLAPGKSATKITSTARPSPPY